MSLHLHVGLVLLHATYWLCMLDCVCVRAFDELATEQEQWPEDLQYQEFETFEQQLPFNEGKCP